MALAGSLPEAGRWICRQLLALFLHGLQGWTCKSKWLERNCVQLVPRYMCALEALLVLDSWAHSWGRELTLDDSTELMFLFTQLAVDTQSLGAKGLPNEISPGAPVSWALREAAAGGRGTEARNRARRSCSCTILCTSCTQHTAEVVVGGVGWWYGSSGEKMSVHSAHITSTCY